MRHSIKKFLLTLISLFGLVTCITAQAPNVTLNFSCTDGQPGDAVCVDITVEDFDSIAAVELYLTWDPFVLAFESLNADALNGLNFQPGPDDLRYLWIDNNAEGVSLPNGTLLFEICFTIVGIPGSSSPVTISQSLQNTISDANSNEFDITINDCDINVLSATNLGALINACGPQGGTTDGFFDITIFGGDTPYTYDWVNTSNGTINGSGTIAMENGSATESVPPGPYEITITDNAGNTAVYTLNIASQGVIADFVPFDPNCWNFSNGRISISAAEGTPPYAYLWQSTSDPTISGSGFIMPNGGSAQVPSLPSGDYDITLTDDGGCTVTQTVSLFRPPFTITENITDATCLGAGDGRANLRFGGATPITPGNFYNVTYGNSTNTLASLTVLNLEPGNYTVTVTDDLGCDTVHTFTVGADEVLTGDISVEPVSCPGETDGRAMVVGLTNGMTGGVYDFLLFDLQGNQLGGVSNQSSANISGLAAGMYNIIIRDGTCRSDSIRFEIAEPPPIEIEIVEREPQGCLGAFGGSVTVSVSGGTVAPGSDYTYSWSQPGLSGPAITNVSSGFYQVTVSDDNNCMDTLDIFVPIATSPSIDSVVAENVSCTGDSTATLTVYFTEGSYPVEEILWTTGDTTPTITGLPPGDYGITIRDSVFCFDVINVMIGPEPIVIDSIRTNAPSCPGDADGSITVFASGGVSPYTFIWSTGDTSQFNLLPGLDAGSYAVTIIDADSCAMIDTTILLEDLPAPAFSFSATDSVSCPDICDGSVTLTPSDGLPGLPYIFLWESGQVDTGLTSTASALCLGYQRVQITQDDICFFQDSVFIPGPDPISVTVLNVDSVRCAGDTNGLALIEAQGGNGTYTYDWENGQSGPMLENVAAGTYLVTVTDDSGCTGIDSVMLFEPDSLIASIDPATTSDLTCGGTDNGTIGVRVEGGQPGTYTYTWDPDVSSGAVATGLGAGGYTITVADANGCMDTTSFRLTMPSEIIPFFPDITDPLCPGDETLITVDSATGGRGSYTYTINNGARMPLGTVVPVPSGMYVISVFDSVGCRFDTTFSLMEPPPIDFVVLPEDPVVRLGDSILLTVVINNAFHPVNGVFWSNSETLSCDTCFATYASNIIPTTYTVTVADTAGCLESTDVLVNVDNNRQVYIPNVFSPNADGINDLFQVFTGQGIQQINTMKIFDRWGGLVFESNNIPANPSGTDGWDGSKDGELLNPGVFVYLVEIAFLDGETLLYRGDVTLVR